METINLEYTDEGAYEAEIRGMLEKFVNAYRPTLLEMGSNESACAFLREEGLYDGPYADSHPDVLDKAARQLPKSLAEITALSAKHGFNDKSHETFSYKVRDAGTIIERTALVPETTQKSRNARQLSGISQMVQEAIDLNDIEAALVALSRSRFFNKPYESPLSLGIEENYLGIEESLGNFPWASRDK